MGLDENKHLIYLHLILERQVLRFLISQCVLFHNSSECVFYQSIDFNHIFFDGLYCFQLPRVLEDSKGKYLLSFPILIALEIFLRYFFLILILSLPSTQSWA